MALTKAGSIVLQQPYRKNFIINGAFDIWQRTTSITGINNASCPARVADRFQWSMNSDAVVRVDRSEVLPTVAQAGRMFGSCYAMQTTTADTSIGATQYGGILYCIEGYDIQAIMGRILTLSFWVRSYKTGIHCVKFGNGSSDLSYIAEYTINASNTYEYKTITFTMHDGASGTWNFTNGGGLWVMWILACGSTFHTTAGVWQTGNLVATSNQVNGLDSSSNGFRLTGVQLELGSVATPFEFRPYAEELALCQRYYEKSYDYATIPGTATGAGAVLGIRGNGAGTGAISYKVTKRSNSTPVVYSIITGTAGQVRNLNPNTDQTATVGNISDSKANAYSGGASISDIYAFQWTLDAEL